MTDQLAQKIKEAIFQNENFDENWNIDVMEKGPVITLLGTVTTKEDRDLVESIAKKQDGVVNVVNELNIKAFSEEDMNEIVSDPEVKIPPTRRQPPGHLSN